MDFQYFVTFAKKFLGENYQDYFIEMNSTESRAKIRWIVKSVDCIPHRSFTKICVDIMNVSVFLKGMTWANLSPFILVDRDVSCLRYGLSPILGGK